MMKYLLSIILVMTASFSYGQSDTMRKMASTITESKGYLIPNQPNDFHVPKGTRVKFTIKVSNEGREEYMLHKDKYLTATYLDKAVESSFPIKVEEYKQSDVIETQLNALIKRKDKVQNMVNDEAAKYAVMLYGKNGVKDKVSCLKFLENKINKLKKAQEAAAKFDKDHTVLPGAELYFSGSGYLPETNKKKQQSHVNINIRVISSDGKYISVPVKCVFF